MIEFGKTLREAREQKGYTVSQLAEMTHILPRIIEELEREDFSKIVAPIYGRGFVKLYCEAVGLESKPLVDEFMSIYTGARPPVIRMKEEVGGTGDESEGRGTAREEAPEPVAPEPEQEAMVEPAPLDEPLDEPPPPAVPLFARTTVRQQGWGETTSVQQQEDGRGTRARDEESVAMGGLGAGAPKRDYRLPGYSMPEVPKRYWRFGVLLVAAVVIVVLLVVGTRALYRATMEAPQGEGEGVEAGERQQAYDNKEEVDGGQQAYDNKEETDGGQQAHDNKNRAPRKGVKIPPLYID